MVKKAKLIIEDEVNIRLEGLPVDIRRKLSNRFKYDIPSARHMPQYKLGRWDGKKGFFGLGGSGYLNHLDVILEILEQHSIKIEEIQDHRKKIDLFFNTINENYWADQGVRWPEGHPAEGELIMLRDYQVEAINNFLKNPQSLQALATGSGKTITTATLSHLCESYGRTLIIVPNKSLVTQTEEDYKNCGLDVGVYFGDRKELGRTHTICTWQSLNTLDKKSKDIIEHPSIRLVKDPNNITLDEFLENINAVIVDEVHQATADVLQKLLTRHLRNSPIRWGLTGTIPKEDHEFHSLLTSIGPVVGQISAKELQDKGVLSNCLVNICQLIDTKEFRSYQEELKYLVSNTERINYIGKMMNSIKETGNTLILVDRISAGEMLQELIPGSVFVKGDVKLKDRKDAYTDINKGNNQVVIATYGVAAVGVNIVRLHNVVLIEPGKSFVRVIQSIGRGLRKGGDKDFVNIWDICSTCKYSKRHLTKRKQFYKEAQYEYSIKKIDY